MQQTIDDRAHSKPRSHLSKRDQNILDVIPEAVGPRLATSKGGAIHSIRRPGSQTLQSGTHFAEVTLAPAPGTRVTLGGDRMHEYDAPVGALLIHPANVEVRVAWSCTRESVIVAIRPESLRELAAKEFDAGQVTLEPPVFGTVDVEALHIAKLIKVELARHEPANELFIDSLVSLFGIHLLRNYTGGAKSPPNHKSGLSPREAKRVQEFLNENFSRKLSVAELAAISGFSPFHFIRAFNKTFGQPPHQYILNLRLTFAEKLLVEGNITIAEVAYLSGFSSQSHLTAAMRKHRNATPAQIRRKK